jgi:hypothetical protein
MPTIQGVNEFYEKVKILPFEYGNLLNEKDSLALNDWFYYKLIGEYVNKNFPEQDETFQTLFSWYVLNKSGFDARIQVLHGKKLYLFVWANGEVYSPHYKHDTKQFVCLNCVKDYRSGAVNAKALIQDPVPRQFSFKIDNVSNIPESEFIEFEKGYESQTLNSYVVIRVKVNFTVMNLMDDYPNLSLENIYNTPMSNEAYTSLVSKLREITAGRSKKEKARMILEFIQNGFLYMEDTNKEFLGRESWSSPEQTLYRSYSDCEDTAGLFFFLSKELLNVPSIVVVYPENGHVNIGLHFENTTEGILYNGRYYSIWETTNDKAEPGNNKLYKYWKYKIVVEYNPGSTSEQK